MLNISLETVLDKPHSPSLWQGHLGEVSHSEGRGRRVLWAQEGRNTLQSISGGTQAGRGPLSVL